MREAWTCLYLPRLAVEARGRGWPPERALAVTRGEGAQRRIHQANESAESLGVCSGQALSAAYALAPDLLVLPRDRRQEAQARKSVAAWAYAYTSRIGLGYANAITAEISASRRLFGGIEKLLGRLHAELADLGFQVTTGTAPTAAAAHLLAVCGDGQVVLDHKSLAGVLGRLPIRATSLSATAIEGLRSVGVRRLGELTALPRTAVARRFGQSICVYLDDLTGRHCQPQPLYQPPEDFDAAIELPAEVDSVEPLAFVLKRLLMSLCRHATAIDRGIQRFEVVLHHAGDGQTAQPIGLLQAERDVDRLLELTQSHLERLALPGPVRAVTVRCRELLPWRPQTGDLLDPHAGAETAEALFERLQARLGPETIRGLCVTGDPRPDYAWRYSDPGEDGERALPVQRPALLLRRPRVVNPAELTLLCGPERIEAGWWDGRDMARDYYIARHPSGARWWVFQDRRSPRSWYLHGVFA